LRFRFRGLSFKTVPDIISSTKTGSWALYLPIEMVICPEPEAVEELVELLFRVGNGIMEVVEAVAFSAVVVLVMGLRIIYPIVVIHPMMMKMIRSCLIVFFSTIVI
jgi:hypothetical protein